MIMSQLPLQNLTVLELGESLPVAYCTKMMADLGADVIKIEDTAPGRRESSEFPFGRNNDEAFFYLNTSKKSLAVELRSAEGRDIVKRAVGKADLVVESLPAE